MTVEAIELPPVEDGGPGLAVAPRREREFRLGELSRVVMTAIHQLVVEIADTMGDGGVVGDSAADMRAWLVHNLGASQSTARNWVQLAQRVAELPETMRRLHNAHVSIDAALIIAKHATSRNEAELAELAGDATITELLRIAKDMHPDTTQDEVRDKEFSKDVNWYRNEREGWWYLNGRLPLADGVVVERALERVMDGMERKDPHGVYYPHGMIAAEALVELAGVRIDSDPDPDRATVVLHMTQPWEPSQQQLTMVENGPVIPEWSAHRLTCDARCQLVTHTPDGTVIGVGRTTRVVPMWLRRLVRGRDLTCRFPGCERTKHLQIHHIRHWSHGGPTDLDNLLLLCTRHHRMVHEHGWAITGSADNPTFELAPGHPYQPIRLLLPDLPRWHRQPLLQPGALLEPAATSR